MAEHKFKGFKVEVASVYNQLSTEDKLDYMWLVRDDENSKTGKIYFGSRLYAGDATSEDFENVKALFANLDTKIDAVDTKTDANALRIDAANEKIDIISEKIDVVKDEASVVYQKIDDIYEDSNKVREDVEEMKAQVADAVETVGAMEQKIADEQARAEAAEKKNAEDIATVNANLVTAVDTINKNVADGFNTINGGIATEIQERKDADAELDAKKVSWMSKDDKRIVLDNHKNILGTSTEGNTYNLAMVSKWDIADFGSTHLPLNLNSSVVPTVQLFGQTGEQAKHIAFAEDVATSEALEAEKNRALAAESALQTNINDNRNALNIAVENLQENINKNTNHIDAVQKVVENNANAINGEIARAAQAEAALQENINKNTNYIDAVQKVVEANANAINSEIARATEAEKKNAADIATVNTNLVAAVENINKNMADGFNTINGGIDNEIRPAIAKLEEAQKSNDDALKAEAARVDGMINQVNQNVADSINAINKNMADGFNTINGGIATEIEDRMAADANLEAEKVSWMSKDDKRIVLDNHKNLLGKDTEGGSYNLAMVSKWNIADFGSTSLPFNINASEVPTVQLAGQTGEQAKHIAFAEEVASKEELTAEKNRALEAEAAIQANVDKANEAIDGVEAQLDAKIEDVELVQDVDNPLKYTLMVDNEPAGEILIPKDQFLKSVVYESETKDLIFTFSADSGDVVSKVNIAELVDTYTAGNGLQVADNQFSIKVDPTTQAYIEVGADGIKIVGINEKLNEKVSWTDISTPDMPTRKAILLKNHDTILGTSKEGKTSSILMLNKWDVVDLGTPQFPINLNTPAGVRPTVQEQGQSGEEAHKIAYVSDVETATASIKVLQEALDAEVTARGNADTQLQSDLQEEATARIAADDAATKALADEVTARGAADTQLQNDLQAEAVGRAAKDAELESSIATEASERKAEAETMKTALDAKAEKTEIPTVLPNPNALTVNFNGTELFNYDGAEAKAADIVVNADVVPMAADEEKTVATKISEMDEEIAKKVTFEDAATEELPERKKISLNNHDIIVGKGTDGSEYGIAMVSKWDIVDFGTTSLPLNLNTPAGVRPTVQEAGQTGDEANEIAYVSDLILMPNEILFPLRTLADKVYTQGEIFKWFGVADAVELKGKIVRGGIHYVKFGLSLTGNPHYYKMPVDYIAFESANQIKMVFNGLDTSNDAPAKYEIIINLDGTIIEDNCNVKITMYDIAMSDEVKSDVIGNLDLQKYLSDKDYTIQVLNKLETSYVEELGQPENINGKPYNADTNNYSIGQPYLAFAKFDESFVFHYDLYALNGTFDMGYMGKVFDAIKITMDTYDTKISDLEKRIAALEGAGA